LTIQLDQSRQEIQTKTIKIANLPILQNEKKKKSISKKKVKKGAYSITTQKTKVFGIFDDQKVKNIKYQFFLTLLKRN